MLDLTVEHLLNFNYTKPIKILTMKNIKISNVHYEMLATVAKKFRNKPDQMIEELIQERFNSSK